MKFYFAPLEGVAGYIYRSTFNRYFHHDAIVKYFAPFIVADQHKRFNSKDLGNINPENNHGITLIPQILSNNGKDFIHVVKRIHALGYREVNFNLGCPSGTVVSKRRGSGFLAYREDLDRFLDEIYADPITDISIKTRLGRDKPEEFYELIKIFNKYPLKELIIHPRTQKDHYKNTPNLQVFRDALSLSVNPVVYNGDIFNRADYTGFTTDFPELETLMLGRGLLANPGFVALVMDQKKMDIKTLKAFHDELCIGYKGVLSGDRNLLFKMKEVWFYMSQAFSNHEKYAKKIRKAERLSEYDSIVASLFNEQEILDDFGHLR